MLYAWYYWRDCTLEIKLLLSKLIASGFFTLGELNNRLLNFNFGYSENNNSVPILSQSLNGDTNKALRATASQMLYLVWILSFLIVHKIPESKEHWSCLLVLRKIIDIVLCPVVSTGLCLSLKLLIREHHLLFVNLYGSISSIVCKFEFTYLIHNCGSFA